MTHTEVLKLVLDALEDRTSLMKWQKARDAVKEALAKQEHGDPLDMPLPCDVKVGHVNIRKGVALRILCARMQVLYEMAQSKQEQGEPVAIIHRNEYNEYRLEPHDNFDIKSIPFNVDVSLYTTPQPQEFVCGTGLCRFNLTQTNVGIGERGMEAYEAAKERGWVGVSDER